MTPKWSFAASFDDPEVKLILRNYDYLVDFAREAQATRGAGYAPGESAVHRWAGQSGDAPSSDSDNDLKLGATEGCKVRYWRGQDGSGLNDGFNDTFGTTSFWAAKKCGTRNPSVADMLNCKGGGRYALARQAAAALANAGHVGVDYAYGEGGVTDLVGDALGSRSRSEVRQAKFVLQAYNRKVCPLD